MKERRAGPRCLKRGYARIAHLGRAPRSNREVRLRDGSVGRPRCKRLLQHAINDRPGDAALKVRQKAAASDLEATWGSWNMPLISAENGWMKCLIDNVPDRRRDVGSYLGSRLSSWSIDLWIWSIEDEPSIRWIFLPLLSKTSIAGNRIGSIPVEPILQLFIARVVITAATRETLPSVLD
jgi:hypothetical protein